MLWEGDLYGTTQRGGYGAGTLFKVDTTGHETVLHAFTSQGGDGGNPLAGLIRDAAGNLFGTTEFGGTYGQGTIFKLDTTGHETVLYAFTGGADGARPYYARLIRDAAGNLYGTTLWGGDLSCNEGVDGSGCGVVFKLTP
jgi:uncharacterized repeat protein (TIGR03803 family)